MIRQDASSKTARLDTARVLPGGVFWIDASSHKSGCQCHWEIAQAANLVDHKNAEDTADPKHYVYTVRRWLQRRRESLLIFDGINSFHDGDLNYLRPFLPWDRRSSIIYTSTDRTLQKNQCLFERYHLLVPPLAAEGACKVLYNYLGIKEPTKEQFHRARELVFYCKYLPIGIDAVGHSLRARSMPIENFHVIHRSYWLFLPNLDGPDLADSPSSHSAPEFQSACSISCGQIPRYTNHLHRTRCNSLEPYSTHFLPEEP